jgi:hypothetical protein
MVLRGVLFGEAGQQRRQAEVLAGLVEKSNPVMKPACPFSSNQPTE